MMHEHGKTDSFVVPQKRSNKAERPAAETVEERGLTKGNRLEHDTSRAQNRTEDVPNALERIRQAAKRNKDEKFTALLHHITVDRLQAAYNRLRPEAAPGVDGVTWEEYGKDLQHRLEDLHGRIQRGAYRARPTRRTYIPKPGGGQRPLGIASLEDKIVQAAVAEVLNAIYEADFTGFSYGFRQGRSQHDALDALAAGIYRKKVNWVLDADIRGFFDAIDHEWVRKFIEHRIADRRILRLIQKWLSAGVLEDGQLRKVSEGSPQGATISPLLANIYLHYAFDLWAHQWRKRHARGDVVVVRYADDIVVCFQTRRDAEQFRTDLVARLKRFGLELHPEKTRLIEFGRFASRDRASRGQSKPETFTFLGFRHICGKNRNGQFMLRRHTDKRRLQNTLHKVRAKMWKRMHRPVPVQGSWLRSVTNGYFQYHAVPTNLMALRVFRREVARHWHHVLCRRSQKGYVPWTRMSVLVERWLPPARILHPFPDARFDVKYPT